MPIDLFWNKYFWRKYISSSVVFLLLCISFDGIATAEELDSLIEGELREKGTRSKLSGINIYLIPDDPSLRMKAETDSSGKFVFKNPPSGHFKWIVNASGYERLEQDDQYSRGSAPTRRKLFLEKTSYQIYETTITGQKDKRDDTQRTLTAAQFSKLPGSGGDPIKAVQNLPGVNRASPINAQVIIQGSAPRDTRYLVNGHEVPLIFHFGGLSSVVIPEAIDRVDYLSAGYGPEYGRAIGGLVGVHSRSPKKDRLHGFGYVDIFNTGAMVEGPIGEKSSFLVGARRSYIGNVLSAIAKDNKSFDLTVAPVFSDLSLEFETELTPRDHLKIFGIASSDKLEFVLKQPVGVSSSLRGSFDNSTEFFRLIPELTHRHSSRTVSRWSFGLGRDWIRFNIGDNFTRIFNYSISQRAEVERKMSESWTSFWGIDNRLTWANVDFSLPGSFAQLSSSAATREEDRKIASVSVPSHQLGFYWRNQFQSPDSAWTWMPNARLDYFNLTKEWIPEPRLATRYAVSESLSLRTAGGLYAQPPLEQEMNSMLGNPDLKSPRAWHLSGGFRKDFREGSSRGWIFSMGSFYRYFDRLVIPSKNVITREGVSVLENYNNDGTGRAYGLESLLKMELKPLTGWLSYTLSRSTRYDPTRGDYIFQYDQTHLLTAILSAEVKGNWTFSTRFRYVTGNPTTPVIGSVFDSDQDRFTPIRGPFFSQRIEPFMQLDLRIDKKWIYDNWILSAYLDIQNVTNRANVESVQYAYDYSSNVKVSGLPFLPTFGIKGEF
jgi:hypothetical protein